MRVLDILQKSAFDKDKLNFLDLNFFLDCLKKIRKIFRYNDLDKNGKFLNFSKVLFSDYLNLLSL